MRCLLALLFPACLTAQPGPPSFCFVLAEDSLEVLPFRGAVTVTQHFGEALRYTGLNKTYAGPWEVTPLQCGPLFRDTTEAWMVYSPLSRMTKEAYILVVHGSDTMWLDLPADPIALSMAARARWDRDTPEVIRFKPGRCVLADLMADQWSVEAARSIALRMKAEERELYEQQIRAQDELYRAQSAKTMVPKREPPPRVTAEDIERGISRRPGVKRVKLDRISADTVWVELSGRVMLDGGCAGQRPLFGIEMRTDSGWVERIPFDLTQMDCGKPWADWKDHSVQLPPLRWWVRNHAQHGLNELRPGRYRAFFVGANLVREYTESFEVNGQWPYLLTIEEIEREIAERPGLKRVKLHRVSADTVWVNITGRVMLNGDCGSNMPLFGVEMLTDSGWVVRLPMSDKQMACGMPWSDWEDHLVMLPPLRWWTGANQPALTRELRPGMYRVVLMGANMEHTRTDVFEVR